MGAKSLATKRAMARALRSLLQEEALSKISIRSLTAQAGVDRQTFYYHFDSMDDLVSFACHDALSTIENFSFDGLDVEGAFSAVVSQVYENRDLLAPILKGFGRPLLREVLQGDVHDALMTGAKAIIDTRGARVDEASLEFAVMYVQYASASIVVDWLVGIIESDPQQMTRLLSASFDQQIRGLCGL